jgi:hypothetical protein
MEISQLCLRRYDMRIGRTSKLTNSKIFRALLTYDAKVIPRLTHARTVLNE